MIFADNPLILDYIKCSILCSIIKYCIICHLNKCYFSWITWSSRSRLNFT